MPIEFGRTKELVNTQYAPLAALLVYYQQNQVLKPLNKVKVKMKTCTFSPQDKLEQVLVSILAGCQNLSEVNQKLKPEIHLAQSGTWAHFADQSGLSRALDALTLKNIKQLGKAGNKIWQKHSQTCDHDWRAYLWLDFDLSGLPCAAGAQKSQRGYFSGKKTSQVVN